VKEARQAKAVLIHSDALEEHAYPSEHPFITKRAALARRAIVSMGLLEGPDRYEVSPEPASREVLETFHTPRYLDALRRAGEGHLDPEAFLMGLGTPDCPIFRGVCDYAVLACGATLAAARVVAAGESRSAFNPSGGYHHAFPERAAGFCYINDVAIGCLWLAEQMGRVVVLDVDAHHADGVQAAFYDRADVMTISLHESGRLLFPGTGSVGETGEGEGEGYAVNVPLPPDTYDEAYLRAFHAIAPPLIRAYAPDVIVLELGLDALSGDPLAHLALTNNVHAEVVSTVLGFGKPLLMTGGGGYHVENTARGWALAWAILCGEDVGDEAPAGLGGVLMETTEWHGGLRDRAQVPTEAQRRSVKPAIDDVIDAVRENVFPIHGL